MSGQKYLGHLKLWLNLIYQPRVRRLLVHCNLITQVSHQALAFRLLPRLKTLIAWMLQVKRDTLRATSKDFAVHKQMTMQILSDPNYTVLGVRFRKMMQLFTQQYLGMSAVGPCSTQTRGRHLTPSLKQARMVEGFYPLIKQKCMTIRGLLAAMDTCSKKTQSLIEGYMLLGL